MSDVYDDTVVLPFLSKLLGKQVGSSPILQLDKPGVYFSAPEIDLSIYDYIVVCLSGGKDSWASILQLLDLGVDRRKIELWHHEVDGREGSNLMDWPFMTSYNRKLAETLQLPLYFSWLEGGFEGEMLKNNSYGKPHHIETPSGEIVLERDTRRAQPGTRLQFPQPIKDLSVRWCSSALKIDVGRRAITNQARFDGKNVLFITGERRDEGGNRKNYNQLEPHACDRRTGAKRRLVDAWRPVLHWSEEQVWSKLQQHGVIAPVPYRLSWHRSSCRMCIFGKDEIWATLDRYFPGSLDPIDAYERRFGKTIQIGKKERFTVKERAARGVSLEINDTEALRQAVEREYTLPILCEPSLWKMPPGAFRKGQGGPS